MKAIDWIQERSTVVMKEKISKDLKQEREKEDQKIKRLETEVRRIFGEMVPGAPNELPPFVTEQLEGRSSLPVNDPKGHGNHLELTVNAPWDHIVLQAVCPRCSKVMRSNPIMNAADFVDFLHWLKVWVPKRWGSPRQWVGHFCQTNAEMEASQKSDSAADMIANMVEMGLEILDEYKRDRE